jgi:hypothetical protein
LIAPTETLFPTPPQNRGCYGHLDSEIITVCKVDVGNFRRLFLFLWLDCVCFVVFEKNPEKIPEGFLTGHHTDTKILGAGLCVFCGWIVTVIVVFEKYSSKIPYINFANGDIDVSARREPKDEGKAI